MIARKPCRCMLAKVPDGAALRAQIDAWIAALPAEQRADEAEAARRLGICRECRWLRDGTCGLCGCYVELRAAKRAQRCPEGRWSGE
ncbi:MAG: hypothetical protein E7317_02245 [Clostridiales bacterium]|nr:hypothetical protein [Clostridiales bacterium]